MRDLLGGKGANLAEMASLKLPVPPGFTISTRVCNYFYEPRPQVSEGTYRGRGEERRASRKGARSQIWRRENPLLVSVRSGARVSMPGMMDTVLNLGLTDETVKGLEKISGNPRFAWDSYRRFCQMFGDVVLQLKPENKNDPDPFEEIIDHKKMTRGVKEDTDLNVDDLQELVSEFRALIRSRVGRDIPQDPNEQLWMAIGAVFGSWNNDRAIAYRRINIPGDWGTAVTVQSMVFGNLGDDCATGVAFTRDPGTGEKGIYGEFLPNAQGEDVVAGIRTGRYISIKASRKWAERAGISEAERASHYATLEESFPAAYKELLKIAARLEKHFRDCQDMEFTIERNRLFMLQTRTGKRTAEAAVRIAVDMADEKLIDRKTALKRVEPEQLEQFLHPRLDPNTKKRVIARGLPASPGAVNGEVVFSADEAVAVSEAGRKVILVRVETSPEDIQGMQVAEGILTARGGMTSHAAVVARGMGKCCVAGCSALEIDYGAGTMSANGIVVRRGEYITLDGSAGEVIEGRVATVDPEMPPFFKKFLSWADNERRLGVRANADTPHDAKVARDFGAEGIGLCRTEHMFFDPERIEAVREMIMAENAKQRGRALAKILPMQRGDFVGILKEMAGLPVTIRLLDPPLHEFLPREEHEIRDLAAKIGTTPERLKQVRESLFEFNPMLGHRGSRLGISYPEIYQAQARAIIEAACELRKQGVKAMPEIMLPLIGEKKEFDILAARDSRSRSRGIQGAGRQGAVHDRHDDRSAARVRDRRSDWRGRRVFLIRHQRPDADDLRNFARRLGQVSRRLRAARHLQKGPVPGTRSERRRRPDANRNRARAQGEQEAEDRHLRRAWRRSRERQAVSSIGTRLRVVLAVPDSGCAPGGGAGGDRSVAVKEGIQGRVGAARRYSTYFFPALDIRPRPSTARSRRTRLMRSRR